LHVDEMENSPLIVASRSKWVRISEDGLFLTTRWQRTFLHDNPASTFFTKLVIDKVGLFDEVRTGADSEYWARITTTFGIDRISTLDLPLSIGLKHENSLTSAGEAGYNEELYSEIRDKYAET